MQLWAHIKHFFYQNFVCLFVACIEAIKELGQSLDKCLKRKLLGEQFKDLTIR